MRYEDWTFRAAEVRLAEHAELRQALELQTVPDYSTLFRFMLRVQEQVIAQVSAEVVRRFQSRKPALDKAKSTVAVDATGLAPGAISTFFIRRREQHGGAAMPWRYWLKWLLAVDTRLRIILAQKAHQGPINDCATLRPLLDEVVPTNPIGSVVADAEFDSERNHRHIRQQIGAQSIIPAKRGKPGWKLTECVRKCERPSPPSFIVNASMLRPSSAQSNANSQPKHRAVRSPRNANKRFSSAWPTTSISSGHFILDFHFMPEAFQQCRRTIKRRGRRSRRSIALSPSRH